MEITSPPATETFRVTDQDVKFFGEVYSGTLNPADSLVFSETEIRIVFANNGETVVIQRSQVLWWSTREREISRPIPTPTPLPHRSFFRPNVRQAPIRSFATVFKTSTQVWPLAATSSWRNSGHDVMY